MKLPFVLASLLVPLVAGLGGTPRVTFDGKKDALQINTAKIQLSGSGTSSPPRAPRPTFPTASDVP